MLTDSAARRGQQVNVRLSTEEYGALDRIAEREDRPLGQVLRRVLRDWLEREGYLQPSLWPLPGAATSEARNQP